MALAQEMLFEPRWDSEEFATLKNQVAQSITQAQGNPNSENVTLDDLKAFHAAHFTLDGASLRLAGDYDEGVVKAIWNKAEIGSDIAAKPAISSPLTQVEDATIYFYDVPGAKQSVLRLSRPALSATNPDYPLADAINFPLGGIYTSKLNTQLRVEKGYTYGIRSGFDGRKNTGTFAVSSSVRSNVTKESLELIRNILANHGPETTEDDLAELKEALLRGQALKMETLNDKLGMLSEIDAYDYAPDFRAQHAKAIAAMTLEDFKRIAADHIRPDAMQYRGCRNTG